MRDRNTVGKEPGHGGKRPLPLSSRLAVQRCSAVFTYTAQKLRSILGKKTLYALAVKSSTPSFHESNIEHSTYYHSMLLLDSGLPCTRDEGCALLGKQHKRRQRIWCISLNISEVIPISAGQVL